MCNITRTGVYVQLMRSLYLTMRVHPLMRLKIIQELSSSHWKITSITTVCL